MITAFMTAFYMFRMWFMTFSGDDGRATKHCHGESPHTMTIPLLMLSTLAVFSGFFIMLGLDALLSFNLTRYGFIVGGGRAGGISYFSELFTNPYTYVTIILALAGIGVAYTMYVKRSISPGKFNKDGKSWLYKALSNRWWFPNICNQVSWKFGYDIARGVNYIDKQIVDGTVNGVASAVIGSGDSIGKIQTGHVQDYASVVLLGVSLLSVLFIFIAVTIGGI